MAIIPFRAGAQDSTLTSSENDFLRSGRRILMYERDIEQLTPQTGDSNVSYNLRIGSRYRDYRDQEPIRIHGGFIIPPLTTYIVETKEYVHFPTQIFGIILPRVSILQRGLSTVASKVDPGYKGHLLISIFNHGKKSIELKEGEQICNLMLLSVEDGVTAYDRKPKEFDGAKSKSFYRRAREWLDSRSGQIAAIALIATIVNILLAPSKIIQLWRWLMALIYP